VPPVAASTPAPAEGPILITNLPKTAIPEPPPGGEIITAGPKAEKLYAGALALYSGRDYQQASSKFKEFVAVYPEHKLAGNAQYWIGECLYSQKRFAEAAEEFGLVERSYPASHKIPAALLKKGLALAELKRMPEARATMQRIVEAYGQSEEAAKAKEKLERWKQP
jgi:tol-pal system protein YbgF